jgi:hypothetical protein
VRRARNGIILQGTQLIVCQDCQETVEHHGNAEDFGHPLFGSTVIETEDSRRWNQSHTGDVIEGSMGAS